VQPNHTQAGHSAQHWKQHWRRRTRHCTHRPTRLPLHQQRRKTSRPSWGKTMVDLAALEAALAVKDATFSGYGRRRTSRNGEFLAVGQSLGLFQSLFKFAGVEKDLKITPATSITLGVSPKYFSTSTKTRPPSGSPPRTLPSLVGVAGILTSSEFGLTYYVMI